MAIGIFPTVDFAFKLLFGSPEHTRVTIHFLNALLGQQIRILSLTIQNPFLGKDYEDDKLSVLDIRAMDAHGRVFLIEMQTTLPAGMAQRLTYYTASVYAEQLNEGDPYISLRPAVSICVLTKPMFPDVSDLHLQFELRTSSGLLLTDNLQIHLLQLSNLDIDVHNVRQATLLQQWAFFLLNAHRLTPEEVRDIFPDTEFSEAAGVLEMISKSPEQKMVYESRLKFQRDEAARLDLAREEALREGRVEGRVEGFREGEAKGVARGELLGQIKLLKQLLNVAEPDANDLLDYDQAQLSEVVEDLQRRLRIRGDSQP